MRDNADDKRSRFYVLEVAIIAAVALLLTVSFTPRQGAPTPAQSPAVFHDTTPATLEPALQILDGVTHHG